MILTKDEAKRKILDGVNRACNLVKLTAGADGKKILIENTLKNLNPHQTKDGVTVLRYVEGEDGYEELGIKLLKEACNRTAKLSGDGTTTTAILAQALINALLESKESHVSLRKGVNEALKVTLERLDSLKRTVEDKDMTNIATISCNNDKELGQLISDIFRKVDVDSVVEVKENYDGKTVVNFSDGIKLNSGYYLPFFITDPVKMECVFENPYVLIYNTKLETLKEIVSHLEIAMTDNRPLLIIANEFSPEVLSAFTEIIRNRQLNLCAVLSPDYGQHRTNALEDLAFISEAKLYDAEMNDTCVLGELKKIIVKDAETIIIPLDDSKISERVEQIQLKEEYNKDKRISNLKSSVVEVLVGGITEMEVKEKKDRIEDAIPALRNAIKDGYIAGGGSTLDFISNSESRKDDSEGFNIFMDALSAPLKTILENASLEYSPVLEYGKGVDVLKREVVDLEQQGIIDPVTVPRMALENATSVALTALETDGLILTNSLI